MILKKHTNIIFTIILLTILVIISCKPPIDYPDTPEIKFKQFELSDDTDDLGNLVKKGILCFNLIDGNGDIGLQEGDTFGVFHRDSLYFHDLFITVFEKKNNTYQQIPLVIPHNFRLPYIEPQGRNKTVKAEIQIKLEYNLSYFPYDSVMYTFFLVDRQLNKSNIDSTPDIDLHNNGIIIEQKE